MNGGLMFHHFTDRLHPMGQGAITGDQFRSLLDWVGFDRILSASEWLDRFRDGTLDGELCLTFDDNLRCQFDVALPVLDDLGLTGLWFVYSSPLDGVVERLEVYRYFRTVAFEDVDEFYGAFDAAIEQSEWSDRACEGLLSFEDSSYLQAFEFYSTGDRKFRYLRDRILGPQAYFALMDAMIARWNAGVDLLSLLWMNGSQWKELHRAGHVIGLHSHTHPTDIASLDLDSQRVEYETNQLRIGAATGEVPTVVAHPASSYSADTLSLLRELGVDVGFATVGPVRFDPRLEVLRVDHSVLLKQARLAS